MNVVERVSTSSVTVLVITSILVSIIYSIRVLRRSDDPLRWALLGVLLSLAITNLVPFMIYMNPTHELPPAWLGWITRIAGTFMLIGVSWPLLKDTVKEALAWVCVTFKIDHVKRREMQDNADITQ